jgi:hypothetical protein
MLVLGCGHVAVSEHVVPTVPGFVVSGVLVLGVVGSR